MLTVIPAPEINDRGAGRWIVYEAQRKMEGNRPRGGRLVPNVGPDQPHLMNCNLNYVALGGEETLGAEIIFHNKESRRQN